MNYVSRRRALVGSVAVFTAAAIDIQWPAASIAAQDNPTTHQVAITKFKFVPDRLNVKPGDTIVWTNLDVIPHTATANDKSWDTGSIRKNESRSITVISDMHAGYFCRFHPVMKAGLVVELNE